MRLKPLSLAAFAVLLAATLVSAYYILGFPNYNGDLRYYIGTALSFTSEDGQRVHARTGEILRRHVPAAAFEDLTAATPYRRAVTADSHVFMKQLPFYTVKPLYPALMLLLSRFGIDMVTAAYLVSAVSYVLTVLVVAALAPPLAGGLAGPALGLLVALFPPVIAAAKLATPDMLSTLLLVTAALVFLRTASPAWATIPLAAAVLARPDNVLFALAFVGAAVLLARPPRPFAVSAAMLAVFVAQYLLQTALGGGYDWAVLHHHTFVERLLDPSAFVATDKLGTYVARYKWLIIGLSQKEFPLFFIAVAVFAGIMAKAVDRRLAVVLLASAGYLVLHFLAFPNEKDRINAGVYALVVVFCGLFAVMAWRYPGVSAEGPRQGER